MPSSKKILQVFILSLLNPIVLIQLLVFAIDGKFLIYRDRISNFNDLTTHDIFIIFIIPQLIFFLAGLFLNKRIVRAYSLLQIYFVSTVVSFFIYGISFMLYQKLYTKNRIETPVEISNQ